jgi:hypothetical protein
MPVRRTKSIGTKVTQEEYTRITALATRQRLSEWIRVVLLDASLRPAIEPIVLAELLALRVIVLNLHYALCKGEPVTKDLLHDVIENADHDKIRYALDCLASARPGGSHD